MIPRSTLQHLHNIRTACVGGSFAMLFSSVTIAVPVVGTVGVNDFGSRGWNADDVRDSSGANIRNDSTHAPSATATLNESAVAEQIDWRNSIGSLGNLGGVALTGTSSASGKSTLSVVDTGVGLGSTSSALGEGLVAVYRWQNTDAVAAGVSFKIGIQSTAWAASQAGFSAGRSGESNWDLILVADPTYNTSGNSTDNGKFVTSVVDTTTTKFKIFGQAGNTYFTNNPAFLEYLGGSAQARTLEAWKLLDQSELGGVIFGSESKITNTQFGFGSGNKDASGVLDYAIVSYLNSGARIDFVDAARYTGAGDGATVYGDAANWSNTAPSSTQNLIVDQDATLEVTGSQDTRSLGVLAGTTGLVLNNGATLVLNSAENGTLSVDTGATLNVTGPGTLQASVIEAGGTLNLATVANLDGGALAHPVRDGGASAQTRYGFVVLGGGTANLKSGAEVTIAQLGKAVGARVGEGPGTATLNIENGATVTIGSNTDRGFFAIGDFGATGIVNQTGGDVSVVGAVNVGAQGGTGTYNLSGGTFNVGLYEDGTDSNGFSVGARRTGSNAAPTGTLNISGGELILTRGYLMVGGDTSPTSGGIGLVNQTGGLVRIVKDRLALGAGANGTANGNYNLYGGVLELGGTNGIQGGGSGNGSYAFNFGGGTLKVINSLLTTGIDASVNPGRSTIDTNGIGAVWSGDLTGSGTLVKAGEGTLTLRGDNNLTGHVYVDRGTIAQDAGVSVIQYMGVGSGDGNDGAYELSGGSLSIGEGGALQVGDWGGTGVFNQTGGTLTVNAGASFNVGNQGGTGVYNLSAGTLNLDGGLYSIGRNVGGNPASTGEFNLSGTGLLNITQGNFIIGNRDDTALSNGSGTFTQTGGTLRVNGGGFFLSGYGDGVYNLNGGTLEIGGTAFSGRYGNSTTSTYAFNFGGGTIRALDSDFATSVNTTLVAETLSTFDSAGHDALWSGRFTGDGALRKTGEGKLTLSGANDFGALLVEDGSVTNAAGTTTLAALHVGANGADSGTYDLTGGVVNVVRDNPDRGDVTIGGGEGGNGTLNITGGQLNVGDENSFSRFFVGAYDGTGEVNQSGGTVNTTGPFHLGNRGGLGTYNLSAGLLNVGQFPAADDSNAFILGRSRTGQQTGVSRGHLNVSGTGSLVLNHNTPLLVGGDSGSTAELSEGYVNQTGGIVTVNSWIDLGSKGYGEYNLFGGILEIGGTNGLRSTSGNYEFNVSNAIIRSTGSAFTTSLNINIVADAGVFIDTDEVNATFSGDFNGAQGALVKGGDGVMTLAGNATRDFRYFNTDNGTTVHSDGVTTVEEFVVGSNWDVKDGTFIMSDGTLKIANPTGNGSMRIGDFGGIGVFTQTGGVVQVGSETEVAALNIGNQGGTGTYNLEGGTLNLAGGINVIGRSHGENPASSGILNISGVDTLLEISNGSSLIVGNNANRPTYGTGTINQSGGTVRVTDGTIYVAGYGDGTYNLTGGVLEVGGNSLIARYNNGVSASTFNFGGGTIKVIGLDDLVTDVRANLVEDTVSIVDTNGKNATFTHGFAGTGGFQKIGLGALTLNGSTDLQADSEVWGLLRIGGGAGKTGTLDLSADLTVNVTGTDVSRLQIGVDGGTGTANFNTGASFTINDAAASGGWGTLDVGRGVGSVGVVNHSAGIVDISRGAFQVGYEGAKGTYELSNSARIQATSGSTVYIGEGAGGDGLLRILDSAHYIHGTESAPGTQFFLGAHGGTGLVIQSGADSEVSIVTSNPIHIGYVTGETLGTTGTYQLDDGTLVMGTTSSNGVRIGESAGATGNYVQNGGDSTFILNNVFVGHSGTGVFTLNDGTARIDAALVLAQANGSSGTLNLDGGVLEVGGTNGIRKGSGTAAVNLGNGTIKVTGSALTTGINATLKSGSRFTVNTNALGTVFSGSLTGTGGLTKTGLGTLQLTGVSDYSGATFVQDGTFRVDGVLSNTVITVGAGAILSGHGTVMGAEILAGGSLVLGDTPGALTVTDDLILATDSYTLLQIAGLSDHDALFVSGTLFAGGTLEIRLLDYSPIDGASFLLFSAADIQRTFDALELPVLATGLEWDVSGLYETGMLAIVTSAIPEPSAAALLLGVLTLGGAVATRRCGRRRGV